MDIRGTGNILKILLWHLITVPPSMIYHPATSVHTCSTPGMTCVTVTCSTRVIGHVSVDEGKYAGFTGVSYCLAAFYNI